MNTYPLTVRVYKGWGLPSGSHYLTVLYHTFDFEVRGVTRREYNDWHQQFPDPVEFEGKLLRECVMSGPTHFEGNDWDWDLCFAGAAQQVLDKIYNISGFGTAPDPEITYPVETYLNSIEARFDLVIMSAYNYKLEELMDMDQAHYHKLLGLAQMKLEMMQIDTEAILYPERAKKRKDAIAIPGARKSMEGMDPGREVTTTTPHGTPCGGAKPFFTNAYGRDPNSPYPPGHPRNPAIVADRGIPGNVGPMSFTSE
jgi:hypothetical protein